VGWLFKCTLAFIDHGFVGGADPWQWWNQVRGLCGHHSKLGVLLEVPENLPPKEEVHSGYH